MNTIKWLKLRRQTIGQRYGLAILVLAITIAFREALTPILGDRAPTLVFTVSVMISTALGGLGPGIFTMFFGFVAARYLWIPPIHQFRLDTPDLVLYSLIYFLVSAGIIVFSLLLRASLLERIENEQRFGSLFKYNLDAVFVLDPVGRINGVNPQGIRLTGFTESELLGRPFDTLCRPDQVQAVQYSLQRALEGRPRDFEFSILRKDGSSAELQFSAGPIIVEDETSGVFGVAKDITSRKQAEAILRDVVKSVKCILSFSEVFAAEGYEKDSMETNYRTIRARTTVLDEEAAQHVLPLDVRRGESYVKAWQRSRNREDVAAMRERACRAILDGRTSYSQEFRAADKFGQEHWFYQLVTVEPRGPRRWMRVAVTTDITERKRAEQILRESEIRYKTLFENNPAAVMIMEAEGEFPGKIISVNSAAAAMNGYSVAEMVGMSIQEFDSSETTPDRFRKLLAGERLSFEAEHRRKDGTVFSLEGTATITDLGGKKCILSIERDITERKLARTALEESEARLNAAFSSIPFDFRIADTEGRYVIQNPTSIAIWGNLVGKKAEEIEVDENIRTIWKANNARALAGQVVREEVTYQIEGTTRHFFEIIAPVFAGEEVRGLMAIEIDVTERRRAEVELLRAKEEAENANIAKDRFIAVMSHELRTPLNPVLMAIHAWKDAQGLPVQLVQDLQMMRHNIEIEVRLISDLLDLTAISKGKLSLEFEPVDIHELLIYAINIAQSQNGDKSLQISEQLHAEYRYVLSDPTRLQQVFWNLISNAVKFTPEGGSVLVSTHNQSGSDDIVVQIIDSGMGMDSALIEKVFDPFEQGNSEITNRYGGLGLGLSIAKGFVEILGGSIQAQSQGEGKGSIFSVTLKTCKDPLVSGL